MDKNVRQLLDSDPGKAYKTLKRLGAQPGENLDDGSFTLPQHVRDGLTNKQSKDMPGGGPQGTILGMFLFIILINKAGFSNIVRDLGENVTKNLHGRRPLDPTHYKFIDDLTGRSSQPEE